MKMLSLKKLITHNTKIHYVTTNLHNFKLIHIMINQCNLIQSLNNNLTRIIIIIYLNPKDLQTIFTNNLEHKHSNHKLISINHTINLKVIKISINKIISSIPLPTIPQELANHKIKDKKIFMMIHLLMIYQEPVNLKIQTSI